MVIKMIFYDIVYLGPIMKKEEIHEKKEKKEIVNNIPSRKTELDISNKKKYFRKEFCEEVFNDVLQENLNSYKNYENIYNDTKTPLKMKIHLLSYKNSKNSRINKFRTEFIAPCTAKQYIDIANNLEIQKKIDTYCDENIILDEFEDKKLLYLSYRKTLFSSPRDFVYLKIIRQYEENGKKYWCDASRSVDTEKYSPIKNVVRCEILKSGHLIEDLSTNEEKKCLVKIYSECDFKLDLPLFIVRNFSSSEMRKFIEKVLRQLKELS